MKSTGKKFGRRDFLRGVGLTAPWILTGSAAIASTLHSPKGGALFAPERMTHPPKETKLRKPERLRFGDVVGLVAPASPLPHPETVNRYLESLEKTGFKPRLAPNALKRLGFLAGTDQERAEDLMSMFADGEVRAVFCLRGGYGSARLLPLLDYQLIRKHPKILIGFSDITSLMCALLTHAGLVSFHGPTLNTNLTSDNPSPFTLHSLLRTMMEPWPPGSICGREKQKGVSVLKGGVATGRLVGGNLSVLCTTLGTPFQPVFKGRILFFEDVDEQPYRFDRMLTQLLNAGVLQQVAGVAVGVNARCTDPDAAKSREYRQTLADVLKDRLAPLGVPVVAGLPFGHVRRNATLPVGAMARLDADRGDLIVTEAAVT